MQKEFHTERSAETDATMGAVAAAKLADNIDVLSSIVGVRELLLKRASQGSSGLLQFRHESGGKGVGRSRVRLLGVTPDVLYQRLVESAREYRFEPVPEPTGEELFAAGYRAKDPEQGLVWLKSSPTAREWAECLGMHTGYTLPAAVTMNDTEKGALRALHFPSELEAILRGLRSKAETALEETGAHVLYLAIGFLVWFESSDSKVERFAPLYLLPVSLIKGRLDPATRTYYYALAYNGDEVRANLALRERLRSDFNLELPEIEDDTRPEAYLAAVSELVGRTYPRWRIERLATLAPFSLGKLLLYLDLEPRRWSGTLTDHPILKRFTEPKSDDEDDPGEHLIDALPEVHQRYPLIDDADSSQHSALVDALDGKNLVIQGPPGTGKSQTITNIIAAALAQGRTVLFVAEKMAALQVVKSRLDRAGFGHYCLELHSNKVQKREVLDSLKSRLDLQPIESTQRSFAEVIARYEGLRGQLAKYVCFMNQPWKATGVTPHQILAAAARYAMALGVPPTELHPEGLDSMYYTPAMAADYLNSVQYYSDAHEKIREKLGGESVDTHPWYGLSSGAFDFFDTPRVIAALDEWQKSLGKVQAAYLRLHNAPAMGVGTETASEPTIGMLDDLARDFASLPVLDGAEALDLLAQLEGEALTSAETVVELYRTIHERLERLGTVAEPQLLQAPEGYQSVRAATARLRALGLQDGTRLTAIARLAEWLRRFENSLGRIVELESTLRPHIGDAAGLLLNDSERGVRALHDFLALAADLPPALIQARHRRFDADELDPVLERLRTDVDILCEVRKELVHTFRLGRTLPGVGELRGLLWTLRNAGLFGWMKPAVRAARRELRGHALSERVSPKALEAALPELIDYVEGHSALLANKIYSVSLGEHFAGLETDLDALEQLRAWHRAVRERFGTGFGVSVPLGETLLDLNAGIFKAVRSHAAKGLLDECSELLNGLAQMHEHLKANDPLRDPDMPLAGMEGGVARVRTELEEALTICQRAVLGSEQTLSTLDGLVGELEELTRYRQAWTTVLQQPVATALVKRFELSVFVHTVSLSAHAGARGTVDFAAHLDRAVRSPWLRAALRCQSSLDGFRRLTERGADFVAAWAEQEEARDRFEKLADVKAQQWGAGREVRLAILFERNDRALAHQDYLPLWFDFTARRARLYALGLGKLVGALDRGDICSAQLEPALRLGINDFLARQLYREEPLLKSFSGLDLELVRDDFRRQDEMLKGVQRQRIASAVARRKAPSGTAGGSVKDFSELALIKHEIVKKKRHIPIRQLVRRAGEALISLKPCFMMSPMSVAQYLVPGQHVFDLLIMDEASQIRPEEAVGAIARAKQVIVVGDQQQLPPTSFFDRLGAASDEEELTAITGSESILEAVTPFFRSRMLRWHYRSQHEALINFSNKHFYDQKLVVFPSPHAETADHGIRYTRVLTGVFVDGHNEAEARSIAQAAAEHLLQRSNESLGIIAMNVEQRDLIERAIEELSKADPLLQAQLERKEQSLFVKNLENVQGDERDVIMISFTYGPKTLGGQVAQRFGPINTDAGHRRLNVLFTRAKRRMHVFTSMGPEDVLVSPTSSRGVRSLRDFLAYAQTGTMSIATGTDTGRPPDSDFEIAVHDLLAEAGFDCVPQLGVSEYFIDIAVRDPSHPGRYLMGIECDGARYHSAKSARDRDRLRQAILEGLGWRIRRVWSTDFFKAPRAALAGILSELDQLRKEAQAEADQVAAFADIQHSALVTLPVEEIPAVEADEFGPAQEARDEQATTGCGNLRERLERFDRDVIRRALPDTPPDRRLLTPTMIDALEEHRPTTHFEFQDLVPSFLRMQVAPAEGHYLAAVLDIIASATAVVE